MSKQQATVKAHSNTQVWSPPERYYRYGGDQPYTPPANPPKHERPCDADGCAGRTHAKGLCEVHYRKSRRGDLPDGRLKSFDPRNCGSKKGYQHHLYHGVEICQSCRDAKNKYERARRAGTGDKR